MTPKIELITRANCPICEEVKSWLKARDISYQELMIDHNITAEEVHERFPWARVLPVCAVDDVPIGGKMEMIRWIVEYIRRKDNDSSRVV